MIKLNALKTSCPRQLLLRCSTSCIRAVVRVFVVKAFVFFLKRYFHSLRSVGTMSLYSLRALYLIEIVREPGINRATQSLERVCYRSRAPALIVIHNTIQEPVGMPDCRRRACRARLITHMKSVERLETLSPRRSSFSQATGPATRKPSMTARFLWPIILSAVVN